MRYPGKPDLLQRYASELSARGYSPDGAQRAAVERLDLLRAQLLRQASAGPLQRLRERLRGRRESAGRGVYLWGGVGRGKTWLMDLFCDSLPSPLRQRRHFHHFMRDVHRQLQQLRQRAAPLQLLARRWARQTRVLCLDELFVSDIADAMLLGGLFEALLAQGVVLVVTSNTAPADLYRDGLQRSRFLPSISLLQRELDVLQVDSGVDYRLRQLQRRPIYLDSTAAGTAAQMQSLFEELATEHGDSQSELLLGGRPVQALRRRGEVVWFNFITLCHGARSQNDYVELAEEFRTVLLSDVPIFQRPEQDDDARRFVALVDEFYDQGTKLVVSAAAAPEQLYRAERLQFEFRRTASRLVEMQSEPYLARAHREAGDLFKERTVTVKNISK